MDSAISAEINLCFTTRPYIGISYELEQQLVLQEEDLIMLLISLFDLLFFHNVFLSVKNIQMQ